VYIKIYKQDRCFDPESPSSLNVDGDSVGDGNIPSCRGTNGKRSV